MSDFNYPRDHSRAAYNSKGQIFWCHNKDDEARAKDQGFTSFSYIRSEWPKQVWHKKTGESKPIGKLEWTDEQNEKALADLGPMWGLENVDPPEPVKAAEPGQLGAADISALAAMMADQKLLVKRLEELEDTVSELAGVRLALETRIMELEALASAPNVDAAKAQSDGNKKPQRT